MKRLISLLIMFIMIFALVSCGNRQAPNTPSSNSSTPAGTSINSETEKKPEVTTAPAIDDFSIENININNWNNVVSENFGINISLPNKWTVSEVSSPNKLSNIRLILIPDGIETYDGFGETLFEKTSSASTRDSISVSTFAETLTSQGTSTWKYYPDITDEAGKTVDIQISYTDNTESIEITFQR